MLTRNSRLSEAWNHPVGHDILQELMRKKGRNIDWPAGTLAGRTTLSRLDKLGGRGFADALIQAVEGAGLPQPVIKDEQPKPAWWKEAVLYRIYLPSFMDANHDGMGDIAGIVQRLPYLENLGVTALWLTALLCADPTGERGTLDFKEPNNEFGNGKELQKLIKAAHARGIKVVLGMDVLSTSDKHPWFVEAQNDLDGPEGQRYFMMRGKEEAPPNNWGGAGIGAWRWMPETECWVLRTGGRHSADLNWGNADVRSDIADSLLFWVNQGADGIVLHSVASIAKADFGDASPQMGALMGIRGFEKTYYRSALPGYIQEMQEAVSAQFPEAFLAGEIHRTGTQTATQLCAAGKDGLSFVVDNSHLRTLQGKKQSDGSCTLAYLKEHFLHWMKEYADIGWLGVTLEGPDFARMVSRLGSSPIYRGILAKLLGTMLLTLRGTPVIYQGEELGLPNLHFKSIDEMKSTAAHRMYADHRDKAEDPHVLKKSLQNAPDHCRAPLPWGAGLNAGFSGGQPWMRMTDGVEYLNATVQMEDPRSVWNHYQKLVALRNENMGLVYGSFKPVFSKNEKLFCYFRIHDGEKWYVEMNITEKEVARPARILPNQHLVVSNYDTVSRTLRPYEANVYRVD